MSEGIVFFGFPLHPVQKPGIERSDHLRATVVPLLFLQGTRDKLARLDLLEPVCQDLGQGATLHMVEGADHGFSRAEEVRSHRRPSSRRTRGCDPNLDRRCHDVIGAVPMSIWIESISIRRIRRSFPGLATAFTLIVGSAAAGQELQLEPHQEWRANCSGSSSKSIPSNPRGRPWPQRRWHVAFSPPGSLRRTSRSSARTIGR